MAILLPDGSQWLYDDGLGAWRHIPDPATAAALGVDENALDVEDSLPGPTGPDWPSADGGGDQGGGGGGSSGASSSPSTGLPAFYPPTGAVYTFDTGAGYWRHVPDPPTANAMGLDWNNMTTVDAPPSPLGPDWPTVTQASSAAPPPPPPTAPAPSPGPAPSPPPVPSFEWGGQTWTQGQLTAFVGYLAAHGTDFSVWAVNHPDAAAILTGPPTDPSREAVPKSVGEALGMAIANGATPQQAADQTAALAAAQAAQGFGAPQGAALLQAAQDVADAYAAAGGHPAPAPAPPPAPAPAPSEPARELTGIVPQFTGNLFDQATTGPTVAWKALVRFLGGAAQPPKGSIPSDRAQVNSAVTLLKGLW